MSVLLYVLRSKYVLRRITDDKDFFYEADAKAHAMEMN